MDTEKFVEFKNYLPVIESNFIKHFVGFGIENKEGQIIYKRDYLNRPIDKWLLELGSWQWLYFSNTTRAGLNSGTLTPMSDFVRVVLIHFIPSTELIISATVL